MVVVIVEPAAEVLKANDFDEMDSVSRAGCWNVAVIAHTSAGCQATG